jgi:hypothetical protein
MENLGDADDAAVMQNAVVPVQVQNIDVVSQQVKFDNILTDIIKLTQVQRDKFVEQGFLTVNDLTIVDECWMYFRLLVDKV